MRSHELIITEASRQVLGWIIIGAVVEARNLFERSSRYGASSWLGPVGGGSGRGLCRGTGGSSARDHGCLCRAQRKIRGIERTVHPQSRQSQIDGVRRLLLSSLSYV